MSCGISRPTIVPTHESTFRNSTGKETCAKTDGNCLMICHASNVSLARTVKSPPPPVDDEDDAPGRSPAAAGPP
jgi:hypothetical protein